MFCFFLPPLGVIQVFRLTSRLAKLTLVLVFLFKILGLTHLQMKGEKLEALSKVASVNLIYSPISLFLVLLTKMLLYFVLA